MCDRRVAASDETDALQVARCVVGDVDAFERLYRRHSSSCLALARSLLVDPHHAEDVVQEAFLDLWRQADRFDARRATARSWVLLLTRRKAIDRIRREQLRQTLPLSADVDKADDRRCPEAEALVVLLGERVRAKLAALPRPRRDVVVLAYWGGYTMSEIARLTAAPLGTVKTRMRMALQDLRLELHLEAPQPGTAAVKPAEADAAGPVDRRLALR